MEPVNKKARLLTDHFRVALRPRDPNLPAKKGLSIFSDSQSNIVTNNNSDSNHHHHHERERKPIELVTISDDDEDDNNSNQQRRHKDNDENSNKQLYPVFNIKARRKSRPVANRPNSRSTTKTTTITTTLASPYNKYSAPPGIRHPSIIDYDQTLLNNVCWEPHYAWDSFHYDRQQELRFRTEKYLVYEDTCELVHALTPEMRAQYVDWLVEIQMNFSLDHEPLYMAVKMADLYLMKKRVPNDGYLLLFMTCILISAKFDERIPPISVSEIIQHSRAKFGIKYSRKQVICLEVDLLTTLDFNIRFPLSYAFLRRFARCTRSNMKTLNLARYILESSLMDYEMIEVLESKIAAGSLLLAFEMLHLDGAWDETAKFYTGYNEKELLPLLTKLNDMIWRFSKRKTAIRRKYSDESFMAVARSICYLDPNSFRNI